MVKLAFVVFPHLEDQRIQFVPDPSDRTVLFRQVASLVLVIRAKKNLLNFFKADALCGLLLNRWLLRGSK
jgi:hypothetical protein